MQPQSQTGIVDSSRLSRLGNRTVASLAFVLASFAHPVATVRNFRSHAMTQTRNSGGAVVGEQIPEYLDGFYGAESFDPFASDHEHRRSYLPELRASLAPQPFTLSAARRAYLLRQPVPEDLVDPNVDDSHYFVC